MSDICGTVRERNHTRCRSTSSSRSAQEAIKEMEKSEGNSDEIHRKLSERKDRITSIEDNALQDYISFKEAIIDNLE